jgi:hypothetical protein
MEVTGVGLNDGYRVQKWDGRTLSLYSATATQAIETQENGGYRYEITLDDDFSSFPLLKTEMKVTGSAIVAVDGSSSPTVSIVHIDSENQKITLSSDVELDTEKLIDSAGNLENYYVFGDVFGSNLQASRESQSAISFHSFDAAVTTFIGSANSRQKVRYQVTSKEGDRSPGSFATILNVAQENTFVQQNDLLGQNPIVTFDQGITSIELVSPLPAINRRPLDINGSQSLDGTARANVSIDGRFINKTIDGIGLTAGTVVDGLVVSGEGVSGSAMRGIRIGGFSNGSNVKIENASNVLVDNVQVGLTAVDTRAGAQNGIYVTSSDGVTKGVVIQGTQIVGSTNAGIKIDGQNTTDTVITSSIVGTSDIINKIGIEILSSDTAIGVSSILPRITKGILSDQVYIYSAEYLPGENEVKLLEATSTEWSRLSPGLVVAGVGLSADTKIVSVDKASGVLRLDKAISRGASEAHLIIGHAATGLQNSNRLMLHPSVPLQNVHIGQRVRVVSDIPTAAGTAVVEEYSIIGMNVIEGSLYLNEKITDAGMGSDSVRLIEFQEPPQNKVQHNNIGMAAGIHAKATGVVASSGDAQKVVLPIDFKNWKSIYKGQEVFGTGIDESVFVVNFDPATREIILSKTLTSRLHNNLIYFSGADNLRVVNTEFSNNVDHGLVIGGGQNHNVGEYKELTVYDSKEAAKASLPPGSFAQELVSGGSRVSIDQDLEFTVGSSVLTKAIHDLITVAEGTTSTNLLQFVIQLDSPAYGVEKEDAVLGDGISLGSKVDDISADGKTITLSQPMAQTLEGVTVRFLKENHANLQKISVYGSLRDIDDDRIETAFSIEAFNVATDKIGLLGPPLAEGKSITAQNAQVYFGLGKWVQVDPSDSSAFAPGWAVEGEGNSVSVIATGDVPDPTDVGTDNSKITNLSDTSDLIVGTLVTGTNIPAGATIVSIDSLTQTITLSAPVTAGTGSTNETLNFSFVTDPLFRVPGETIVEAIFHSSESGYIALSATEAGNEYVLLPGKVFLDEIRFAKRDAASNSFVLNGGYGITSPDGSTASLYEDISATWTVAGSYIGIQRTASGTLISASNQQGSLNKSIFAKLMVDSGSDQLFSRYAKTDRYGNQYELPEPVPVNGEDDGEVLLPPVPTDPDPDNPDNPDNPNPDPDPPGDPPTPEDEIWPGLPF